MYSECTESCEQCSVGVVLCRRCVITCQLGRQVLYSAITTLEILCRGRTCVGSARTAANMLERLPAELLLHIADALGSLRDVDSLGRVCRQLYGVLDAYLYERNAARFRSDALVWAASHGQEATARKCIQTVGVDVNTTACIGNATSTSIPITGTTRRRQQQQQQLMSACHPLVLAVRHEHAAVVKALLAVDEIDVNWQDGGKGRTALAWAAAEGRAAMVELLLQLARGIDVNCVDIEARMTPLALAASRGHVAVVRLLLARPEVDVNLTGAAAAASAAAAAAAAAAATAATATATAPAAGVPPLDPQIARGYTPLMLALSAGHMEVARLILKRADVDVNVTSSEGWNALRLAILHERTGIAKALLRDGRMQVDAAVAAPQSGRLDTPLMMVVEQGNVELADILLKRNAAAAGAAVDMRDIYGNTPLLAAAKGGSVALFQILLDRTTRHGLQSVDREGNSCLALAVAHGHPALVEYLLSRVDELSPDLPNHAGETPLILAANRGFAVILKLLLDRAGGSVNVNHADNRGRTAWDHARLQGYKRHPRYKHYVAIQRLLSQKGARLKKRGMFRFSLVGP